MDRRREKKLRKQIRARKTDAAREANSYLLALNSKFVNSNIPLKRTLGKPSLVDAIVTPFFSSQHNRTQLRVYQLKRDASSTVLAQTIKAALKQPAASRAVTGIPFPKKYSDMGFGSPIPFTGALQAELRWTMEIVCNFGTELNQFLALKNAYEKAILEGDLPQARDALSAITIRFGITFWSMIGALLLEEKTGGLKAIRELTGTIQDSCKDPLTSFLASFLSIRSESALSRNSYDTEIDDLLARASVEPEGNFAAFVRFRLKRLGSPQFSETQLAGILHLDARFPIIDRYLLLVQLLQLLAAAPDRKITDRSLFDVTRRLADVIHDPQLVQIKSYLDPAHQVVQTDVFTALAENIDHYTRGDYATAASLAAHNITRYPVAFDFYELFVKSLLHLRSPLSDLSKAPSLSSDIITHVYHVLARDEKTTDSLDWLTKTAYSLDPFPISTQMFTFVREEETGDDATNVRLKALSGSALTPRCAMAFGSRAASQRFLQSLSGMMPTNAALLLFEGLFEISSQPALVQFQAMPTERRTKYQGWLREQSAEPSTAISQYEALYDSAEGIGMLRAHALRHLYSLYLRTAMLLPCATKVVDTYLTAPAVLLGIPLESLLEAYEKTGGYRKQINLAWCILHFAVHQSDPPSDRTRTLFRMYTAYLSSKNVEKPSELTDPGETTDRARLVFFLRHICTLDVMDSTLALPTRISLEDERIAICQLLTRLNAANTRVYEEEIKGLVQARAIRDTVHTVEQGKIYVDTTGLVRALDRSFRERFDRLVELQQIGKQSRRLIILLEAKGDRPIHIRITDMAYELFVDLLYDLRTRFLSSTEYGLDSYLSVRIRHGTLSGQIRSKFEAAHLITRKAEAQGDYGANLYWRELLTPYGQQHLDAIDGYFREFSAQVDQIIDEVKDKWIQITGDTEKKEGLFDYSYTEDALEQVFHAIGGITEYDAFVQAILSELWGRTREVLKSVRQALTTQLRDKLTDVLNNLERHIMNLLPEIRKTDLSRAIVKCRTDIQNELATIASWFNVSEDKGIPDYAFGLAIETSLAIVGKIHPNIALNPTVTVKSSGRFRGKTLRPFIDALLILLDNVVKHCDPNNYWLSIEAVSAGDELRITVTNHIPPATDLAELRLRMQEAEERRRAKRVSPLVRKEGGSGLIKLQKILEHDLGLCQPVTLFEVDDSYKFKATVCVSTEGLVL